MKHLILLFAILVSGLSSFAQKPFAGTVNYKWQLIGEGVEQMEAFMPTNMILVFGKGGARVSFQGGMMGAMMGEFMYSAKSKKSYMIKESEKTAYEVTEEEGEAEPASTYDKEDEIINILGYSCQKYKVTSISDGVETSSYVWVTDQIKPYNADKGSSLGMTGVGSGIGFPLKVMTMTEGMTIVMTVGEINTTAPSKTLFSVPKGYAVEPFTGM